MDFFEKLFDTDNMKELGCKILNFLKQNPDIAEKIEKELLHEYGIITSLLNDDLTLETFSLVMESIPKVIGWDHEFFKQFWDWSWKIFDRKIKEMQGEN